MCCVQVGERIDILGTISQWFSIQHILNDIKFSTTYLGSVQVGERIDYILSSMTPHKCEVTLKAGPDGQAYSDHFAVTVSLRFNVHSECEVTLKAGPDGQAYSDHFAVTVSLIFNFRSQCEVALKADPDGQVNSDHFAVTVSLRFNG